MASQRPGRVAASDCELARWPDPDHPPTGSHGSNMELLPGDSHRPPTTHPRATAHAGIHHRASGLPPRRPRYRGSDSRDDYRYLSQHLLLPRRCRFPGKPRPVRRGQTPDPGIPRLLAAVAALVRPVVWPGHPGADAAGSDGALPCWVCAGNQAGLDSCRSGREPASVDSAVGTSAPSEAFSLMI